MADMADDIDTDKKTNGTSPRIAKVGGMTVGTVPHGTRLGQGVPTRDVLPVVSPWRDPSTRNWRKIVLTGGVCSGKSTSIARIAQDVRALGWRVMVVAETATELKVSGIDNCVDVPLDVFQRAQTVEQLTKERVCEEVAEELGDPTLILCDRGVLDGKSFTPEEEYDAMLDELGLDEAALRDAYDGIVFLVTAADGAPEAFAASRANNSVRTEDVEGAIENDRRLQQVWSGHPRLCVIDNDGNGFDEKVAKASAAVREMLGAPRRNESARTRLFLVRVPDGFADAMRAEGHAVHVERMEQTYLTPRATGEVRRLRYVEDGKSRQYYLATQTRDSEGREVSEERLVSRETWAEMREREHEEGTRIVTKRRVSLVYRRQYLILDLHDGADGYGLLGIELAGGRKRVSFPRDMDFVEEVTGKAGWTGHEIAERETLLPDGWEA